MRYLHALTALTHGGVEGQFFFNKHSIATVMVTYTILLSVTAGLKTQSDFESFASGFYASMLGSVFYQQF